MANRTMTEWRELIAKSYMEDYKGDAKGENLLWEALEQNGWHGGSYTHDLDNATAAILAVIEHLKPEGEDYCKICGMKMVKGLQAGSLPYCRVCWLEEQFRELKGDKVVR